MNTLTMWRSLRMRMGTAPIPLLRRQLSVQHFGLPEADEDMLQHVFDKIGRQLGVAFELNRQGGDIVLLDVPLASSMSSQLVVALAEGRPVVLIAGLHGDEEWLLTPRQRFDRRERLLLRQLRELPLVRERAAAWVGDHWAQSEFGGSATLAEDDAQPAGSLMHGLETGSDGRLQVGGAQLPAPGDDSNLQLLLAVRAGNLDPQQPSLSASYGPGAHLHFDFRKRLVESDPAAQRLLRVHREMPRLAPGAVPASDGTVVRDLDQTLWDLSIACGAEPLLQEPANWWRMPLQLRVPAPDAAMPGASICRYSRAPRHRELARCLAEGPVTPAVLSRRARVGTSDLRAFLQACLMLDLVAWCPRALES